ncbi:MAG: hypothetical protein ABJG78_00640 [Cyclobacteriaceae bacterium]
MKNILYIVIGLFVLVSCTDFDIEDQGFDLQELPESVSFDGGGDGVDADDDGEEGESVTLTIEAPNGTQEDIVVTYTLGGTAVFGVDYTIAGATAAGGTATIVPDLSDVNNFSNGDIDITLSNDRSNGEADETIIVTLTSATRGGETVAVGRGGTAFGTTATVTVEDVPFEFDLSTATLSGTEGAVGDTLTFYAELSFDTDVDVTYNMNVLGASSLTAGVDFVYATTKGSIDPGVGTPTIAAGETQDTVRIVLVDNGAITSVTAQDSVWFNIIGAAVSSGDIWVGGATTNDVTNADTVRIAIADDVKRYGFDISTDTVSLGSITTYNYTVSLADTTTAASSVAFDDVTINYAPVGTSTAVAGVDYDDLTAGSVTIAAGQSSTVISIRVLATNDTQLSIALGAHASVGDAEVLGVGSAGQINLKLE